MMRIAVFFRNSYRAAGFATFITVFIILMSALVLYVKYDDNKTKWIDLLPNLLAGSLDTLVAVLLLSWLVEKRAQARLRPLKLACYIDLRLLVVRFGEFWTDLVKASSNVPTALDDDLSTEHFINQVSAYLNISAESSVAGRSWADHAQSTSLELLNLIDRIYNRYLPVLDEGLLSTLSLIENAPTINVWKLAPEIVRIQSGTQFEGSFPIAEDFDESVMQPFKSLNRRLQNYGKEFIFDAGYFPPFDFSFRLANKIMNERNDIAPLIGSGRRREVDNA